jgi:hypothetical protein
MFGWLPRARGRMTAARPVPAAGQLVRVSGMATVVAELAMGNGLPVGITGEVV